MSAAPAAPPAVWADVDSRRSGRGPAAVPDRHVLPGRTAAAQARPQRAGDQGDPAAALAADLRHHVQPDPRDPDRRRALPGLPRAGDHGPVGAVHRDLLRHPDHLGAGRRRADQAAGNADTASRAGCREGVRVGGTGDHAGGRRARRCRAARRRADDQPAQAARHVRRRRARHRVLLLPVRHARRLGAQARAADGHRPGDHDAAVLRLQRALPGRDRCPAGSRSISLVNPLSYEVSALRGLLIGMPTNYWLDFGVLTAAAVAGICMAGAAIGRLSR